MTSTEGAEAMSGGTPAQNLTLALVIGVVVAAIVLWVVVGRVRRARATGAAESGSVRTRAQAKEIADRIHAYCAGEGTPGDGPRVEVLGAARLQAALRADDRFEVSAQGEREGYWSFRVPSGRPEAQGIADILVRNGVTAVAPSST